MSNRGLYIIVGSIALAVIVFVFLFQNKEPNEKDKDFKKIDWSLNYKKESKNPYGTYLFYEIMKHNVDHFITVDGDPSFYLDLKADTEEHDLLILFETRYESGSPFWENLVKFIDAGNSVLFIQEYDPFSLENYFSEIMQNNSSYKMKETLHFTGETKKYPFQYLTKDDTIGHNWSYFQWRDSIRYEQDSLDPSLFSIYNKTDIKELYIHEWNDKDKPVFVEFIYDGGSVYIYRTPIVFTNLYLVEEKNVEHLEKIISKLKFDGVIYNLPEPGKKKKKPRSPRVSPLQFILSNKSLSWAYFIALGGLILFFLFNLKRKQKPVPVLPPKQNTTLEFVDAVSKVYYQKHNNLNLVGHQYRIFTTFIRTRYHIQNNKNRDEYVRAITARSGVEEFVVKEIVTKLDVHMKLNSVTDEQIIKLHKLIDQFYKNCK